MNESTYKPSAARFAQYFFRLSLLSLLGFTIIYETRPLFRTEMAELIGTASFPIAPVFFQDVAKITVNNYYGEFSLKKNHESHYSWKIDGVNRLPAQENKVMDILEGFSNLTMLNRFDLSLANTQNFQIDKPQVKMKLTSPTASHLIKVGTIDQNKQIAYMTIDDKPYIYEVYFGTFPFHNMIAQNFVETTSFQFTTNAIENLTIYHGNNSRASLDLSRSTNIWRGSKKNHMSEEKVHALITNLKNIKVEAIVDSITNYEQTLKKYLSRPLYNVVIKSRGEQITLQISKVLKNIPELKLETKGQYLLTSSERSAPYIINQKSIELFNINEQDLKEIKISDVIY